MVYGNPSPEDHPGSLPRESASWDPEYATQFLRPMTLMSVHLVHCDSENCCPVPGFFSLSAGLDPSPPPSACPEFVRRVQAESQDNGCNPVLNLL